MRRNRSHGFTLIELLIVVAIIAILAAIAVPNFLEAQVRAKVSRVKSDLRTLATGIESYCVDHGKPFMGPTGMQNSKCVSNPLDPLGFDVNGDGGWPGFTAHCMKPMTTPVAYLTSLLIDPFRDKFSVNYVAGAKLDPERWYVYNDFECEAIAAFKTLKGYGYTWHFRSVGPARIAVTNTPNVLLGTPASPTSKQGWQNQFVYDPSNGTISHGTIMRTNKGETRGPFN